MSNTNDMRSHAVDDPRRNNKTSESLQRRKLKVRKPEGPRADVIRENLHRLPEKYQAVMECRYRDGLSVVATAKQLMLTTDRVKALELEAKNWIRNNNSIEERMVLR